MAAQVRFSWSTVRNILEPDAARAAALAKGPNRFAKKGKDKKDPNKPPSSKGASAIVPAKRTYAVEWEDEDSAGRSCLAAFCASAKKPKPAKRVAGFLAKRGFAFVASPHDLMNSA